MNISAELARSVHVRSVPAELSAPRLPDPAYIRPDPTFFQDQSMQELSQDSSPGPLQRLCFFATIVLLDCSVCAKGQMELSSVAPAQAKLLDLRCRWSLARPPPPPTYHCHHKHDRPDNCHSELLPAIRFRTIAEINSKRMNWQLIMISSPALGKQSHSLPIEILWELMLVILDRDKFPGNFLGELIW